MHMYLPLQSFQTTLFVLQYILVDDSQAARGCSVANCYSGHLLRILES